MCSLSQVRGGHSGIQGLYDSQSSHMIAEKNKFGDQITNLIHVFGYYIKLKKSNI